MFSLRSTSDAATAPAPTTSAPKFPIYLLPTFVIPFRRRRQGSTASYGSTPSDNVVPSLSSTPTSSTLSSPVDGPPTPSLFPYRLTSSEDHCRSSIETLDITKLTQTQPDTIRCSTCSADFAFCSQIVSKGFTGRYGRAYLVSPPGHGTGTGTGDLINIKVGKEENRVLVTGAHLVADITCAICHAKVGWKYVNAKEESQKYKVGKFILETQRCVDHRSWEDVAAPELSEVEAGRKDPLGVAGGPEEAVVFDSEDEDECEDLFSGTWDPEVVAKRRSRKVNQRPKKS